MQQTKKFKMADAISPYLAVSCGLRTKGASWKKLLSAASTELAIGRNELMHADLMSPLPDFPEA